MRTRARRSDLSVIRMDPDCAICFSPAERACDCEAKGLETAIKQAETRVMKAEYERIRGWVRARAQDYILEYFRQLSENRKLAHSAHLDQMKAYSWFHFNHGPHPSQLAEAHANLKRGIDEDWRTSVQRYPEVLEYFFGLVEYTVPNDDDPDVRDVPLTSLHGYRKSRRRRSGGGGGTPAPYRESFPRTPPPPDRRGRRTPGARDRERRPHRQSQPTLPQGYYSTY